jgi:hypothetical protein
LVISYGYVVDADAAKKLERELNEAKKSPWKPFKDMTPDSRDGRWLMFRWQYDGRKFFEARYFEMVCGEWLTGDVEDASHDNCYERLEAEYMEIPN